MKITRRILLMWLYLSFGTLHLYAQTIEEKLNRSHPDCKTMLQNAMDVLPELYRVKSMDSLEKAVEIWERSCSGMPEIKLTRLLIGMEEDKFSVTRDIDGATLNQLSNYAADFPYQSRIDYPKNSFFRFSAAWAKLLLSDKKLDENEKFICRVLSGEITNPFKVIEKNPQVYPEYAAMLEKHYEQERREPTTNIGISTGVWMPTGNLKTLGVHPSFGLHVGMRNRQHEVNLTMQFRYLHSANAYAVERGNHLDSTDYYLGGYIGLDYNYYLVSNKKYEFGILLGMGYDGFDFAPDPTEYYYYEPYFTSHVTIGSFNANAGLRFNYFLSHAVYIGLQGRYNAIHYANHGGTDLRGDAFSIDLIFGFTGLK